MTYLSSNFMYSNLSNIALEESNWATSSVDITLKCLLHDGSFFSMINIDDNNDIKGLFKFSRSEAHEIIIHLKKAR